MRKSAVLILICSMIVSLCACAKVKSSGITLDAFEIGVIKEIDENGSLDVTENSDGFAFTYLAEDDDITISGTADKKKNITCGIVEMTGSSYLVNVADALTEDYLADILSELQRGGGGLKMSEVQFVGLLIDYAHMEQLFAGVDTDEEFLKSLSMFVAAKKEPQVRNGWKYSVDIDKTANKVSVRADFIGK